MASDDDSRSSARGPALFGEKALVARAAQGETAAFEQLYRHHVGPVLGLCLRMTADRARAEELTQAVFVRAWTKLDGFRGESAFSSWLHRLAVNVVLSELRSRSRREDLEEVLDPEAVSTVARGTFTESGAKPAQIDLERAIAKLPLRARQVFVLFEIHGYRHREIAEMLGIADGTCKAQLSRARRLVRETLSQ